jgi:acetoacetate decarboxylase
MTVRRSSPAEASAEDARRARVLPRVDRASRVAEMLDRWEAEDVSDEPEWSVAAIGSLNLRAHSIQS